jgi:hypothetical protein
MEHSGGLKVRSMLEVFLLGLVVKYKTNSLAGKCSYCIVEYTVICDYKYLLKVSADFSHWKFQLPVLEHYFHFFV